MPHDWGVTVPKELSTEEVFEIRDKLRAGSMMIELPACVQNHPKCAEWQNEMNVQTLAAYERETERRRS